MIKIIANVILILFVILMEINILPFFYPFNNLNLALIIIIFIELVLSYKISLYWAAAVGLIYDSFSLAPFPLFTGLFVINILLIKFISSNLINVKSLPNYLIMVLINTLFFNLILISLIKYIPTYFINFLNCDKLNWQSFVWQIILNLILFTGLFTIAKFILRGNKLTN